MQKELNIKNIKKEIVDKLMNNMEILQYLEAETLINEGYTIPKLYNNLIYDYDVEGVNVNYISVEVAEADRTATIKDKKYTVIIKMGLVDEEKVSDMSSIVTDIVEKLYPDREKFSNVAYRVIENEISVRNGYPISTFYYTALDGRKIEQLHRMITFEIT